MVVRHAAFIGRTVIVRNGNVDEAVRVLNNFCTVEGIFTQWRKMERYEKPYMVRKRINHERCRALYDEDMQRKVTFFSRKNRADPYPAS